MPDNEKALPEPPKKAAKPARRLSPAQRKQYAGKTSWNGKPKRDWDGPDLPPRPAQTPYEEENTPPAELLEQPQEGELDSDDPLLRM